MANVLHRITKQYLKSVNTPDYPELDWLINPVLPDCAPEDWIIESDSIREMTKEEKSTRNVAKEVAESIEEQARKDKELSDKIKVEEDKSRARNNFIALSIDEKLLYLYDMR